jgi:hypothetical protein
VRPGWPWRSSSSKPPRPAGAQSTHPTLVVLVRAGATFVNGKLVERPDETPQPEAARWIFIHRSAIDTAAIDTAAIDTAAIDTAGSPFFLRFLPGSLTVLAASPG